jgi:hypothetical protein
VQGFLPGGAGDGPPAYVAPMRRRRILIGAAAAALIAAAVAVLVLVSGGGSTPHQHPSHDPAPVAARCLQLWNTDEEARSAGRDEYSEHGYRQAEVTRIAETGGLRAPRARGTCTVVFAAPHADREAPAAGLSHRFGVWLPLSEFVARSRLGPLQAEALRNWNAELLRNGRLRPAAG